MQMKANKAFYVIGGITALVVTLMAGFLFSGSSSTTTAETKKEDALVRREIYRLALRILEGNIINLSKAHLYALDSLIFSGNGKRTELPGGYLGLIKEKKLYFIKAE